MEATSASLSRFKNSVNKYLLKADYVQCDQSCQPCAKPPRECERILFLSKQCPPTPPPPAGFPEEAFIQNSLGGPSKQGRHRHARGLGMGALPEPCFPALAMQQGGAVLSSR